jgi:hypothetical protein
MRLPSDSGALPARRGRRILIAALILLLVMLPLYLWPLRGGRGGLPSASALSGSLRDPRNPAAVAGIPSDVWDALMARTGGPAPAPPKPPLNLTMIAAPEEIGGARPFGVLSTGAFDGPLPHRPGMIALLGDGSPASESKSGGDDSPSSPVQFLASSSNQERGTGNGSGGFGSGGYPSFSNLGPWSGGGSGDPGRDSSHSISPGSTWDPTDSGLPAPTPEPATIVLVGSNLALLGAFGWRRRRGREETDRSG